MTSLSLQYGRFHYSLFANIQMHTTFSTDLDETGIKIQGLLRSLIKNIVIIRVAVPFKPGAVSTMNAVLFFQSVNVLNY